MNKLLWSGVSLIAVASAIGASAVGARAADMPVKAFPLSAPPPPAVYNWTGFYTGLNVGAAWGSYDPQTSTTPDGIINLATARVNAAGIQSINPVGFTGGSQAGYNWQWGHWVAGIETDFNYLHLNGAANSGSVRLGAATQVVVSSYADADWLFTLRPRLGWAANNWLFYATGGLAVADVNDDFVLTAGFPHGGATFLQAGRIDNAIQTGWTAGGGIETGITDRLSVKAEYLHVDFDRAFAAQTTSSHPAQVVSQSADLRADIVRFGFNYRLGGPDTGAYAYAGSPPVMAPAWGMPAIITSNWEFDAGSRIWFSSGSVGAPQPLLDIPQVVSSRLIYGDLNAISGETYARADHASGLFVKGYLGAGGIINGNLHDEDFPTGTGAADAYSNTVSSAAGSLAYATIDLGYTFLRSPGAKVGAFVGYNYYTQHVNSYSCTQLAGGGACLPVGQPNYPGVIEDDHFNSVRVGLSSEYMLTDRLKFIADAAYVPWTDFGGQDDHNGRRLLIPGTASTGDGVMLEAILSYYITPNWNIGVGGRYWAWNTTTGTETFNFLGSVAPPGMTFARFTTERYGAFVQMGYHFGDPPSPVYASAAMPIKAPASAQAPMNWTGIYVGGHLGGGSSDDHVSDPIGTIGRNFAGFGDTIHGTGPLGGGQIGANWQTGPWVLGVQADASAADLRGENTCFTALDGINCQDIIKALGTVAGRVGYAWNRALVYAKAGGAWADTTYNLNANNQALKLGTGSTTVIASGWVAGAGIEYALTNRWSTMFEYDHVALGGVGMTFPTIAVINTQSIGVRQSIDVAKLGVNYKIY